MPGREGRFGGEKLRWSLGGGFLTFLGLGPGPSSDGQTAERVGPGQAGGGWALICTPNPLECYLFSNHLQAEGKEVGACAWAQRGSWALCLRVRCRLWGAARGAMPAGPLRKNPRALAPHMHAL